jgi:hypothetical protein
MPFLQVRIITVSGKSTRHAPPLPAIPPVPVLMAPHRFALRAALLARGCVARALFLSAALLPVLAAAAAAQGLPDSSVDAVPRLALPVAAWASASLGPGSVGKSPAGGVASALSGTLSVGPLLVIVRGSDVGPYMSAGDGVNASSVLVGARTSGSRLFASGALGLSRARHYHECDQCGYRTTDSPSDALAYDVTLHANAYVVGLALSLSGNAGSGVASYSAVTLGVELGWFGR